ncbi:scavenger receptor cysteine-rich type 1 protein M130 [Pimephales promelas]|uniref:scavenger receptor cysteine-rich type 1 protein M130 n=1 Tax=Pimephales promelas TaxID=90988 RepID=UPI0019555EC5|nr:scavenger receptor cysteine-rich type 1 protein M130 [Pimephales promelas]XP_039543057.1 scavenger receptor cysteine-rich type 1 protein M130 [Pimephales promelas]
MLRPLLDFTLAVVLNDYLFTGGQDIKLVNGLDSCFGTVEVLHNGTWGTVCDDSWDIMDAVVVCRQLGCGRAISALGQSLFGKGKGQFWMKSVSCSGKELFISNCSHENGPDCDHSKDAGVVCSASSVVIIGAVVIAVLFILSALLIIFLVKRRKKQKKLQICPSSNDAVNMEDVLHRDQNEENADDDYEIVDMDDGDVNSDSEQDYINVNQDDTEQDYVNVESDNSEQDYVNVETDDSEQDYVNITQ